MTLNLYGDNEQPPPSLAAALHSVQAAGQLFVTAAGNDSQLSDIGGVNPASLARGNSAMLAVGASDPQDLQTPYSSFSAVSTHLFATGSGIYSTTLRGGYTFGSGAWCAVSKSEEKA